MNTWYLATAKFTKEFTDGTLKRVSEQYLFNAVCFKDVEERVHEEVGEYVRGEFQVKGIIPKQYDDIFHYDDAETWYDLKVDLIVEDGDSGKEKKLTNKYLVSAHSVREAEERIQDSLKGIMSTYEVVSVVKSKIVEIFPYIAPDTDGELSEEE